MRRGRRLPQQERRDVPGLGLCVRAHRRVVARRVPRAGRRELLLAHRAVRGLRLALQGE
ncbi:hypothetical protein ebA4557 [Aromatoleum aromaticum EbN1]|uniref:Uncharacterized protein n=1 Tax=Aromatoleum aromaticum (strain DSM 19018 / LMG 30748 / EbN1) TaxID=76114 RepID=Q5P1V9_AROAE|nr:hypothetical protein ebA4557 [Aromatoleum aromaticum EbN1]